MSCVVLTVAVCLLMVMDDALTPDDAIAKVRELRGPGAIQSVKVKWVNIGDILTFRQKVKVGIRRILCQFNSISCQLSFQMDATVR